MSLLISKGASISMNLFIIIPHSLGLSPLLSISITLCPTTLLPIFYVFPDSLLLAPLPAPAPAPKLVLNFFFCLMSSNL